MQIYEITRLNENVLGTALGAAASGAASALGVSGDVSAAFGSIGGGSALSGYGDARLKAAATAAKPLITANAKKEMQSWNTALNDLMKQRGVTSADRLDDSGKEALKRDLYNRIHKVLMQGKLGNDYVRELPARVDTVSQPAATALVDQLNLATQSILDWSRYPIAKPEEQLAQWQNLSQSSYDAMALAQFYPDRVVTTMPKILGPNPDGTYNIGNTPAGKLTSNPVDTLIISKINAERTATPGRDPEIKFADDGSITIGSQRLDPTKPDEARAIQRIKSIVTGAPVPESKHR